MVKKIELTTYEDLSLKNEISTLEDSRKRAIYLVVGLLILGLMVLFTIFYGNNSVTGYAVLEYNENISVVSGSSPDEVLSFEKIPNFVAKINEKVEFQVKTNNENIEFFDDTSIFDISANGKIEFIPNKKNIGKHNVWIIIKNDEGQYYYQNVVIIIEE